MSGVRSRVRERYLPTTLIGRLTRTNDSGASLIIALIMITVVALVTVAILVLANTGVRTTVALRDQASVQYQADNAMQTAIETLRSAQPGADLGCVPGVISQTYASLGTSPGGAVRVDCSVDSATTLPGFVTAPNSGPGTALLALDGNITINTKTSALINGGIFANDQLIVNTQGSGSVTNTWPNGQSVSSTAKSWVLARNGTTAGCSNILLGPNNSNASKFQRNCNLGPVADIRGMDPGELVYPGTTTYTQPVATGTFGITGCGDPGAEASNVITVRPGTVDVAALNGLSFSGGCNLVHFEPGVYYFDSGIWTPPSGYYVAGKWAPSFNYAKFKTPNGNSPVDISGACIPPINGDGTIAAGAGAGSGVEFVFGPNAGFDPNDSSKVGVNVAVCATPTTGTLGGPPVAIYGAPGQNPALPVFSTQNCPSCNVTLLGTVYAPSRDFAVGMNNNGAKSVAYGIIAKSITFDIAPNIGTNVTLAGGMPEGADSPVPVNYQRLTAYVCPGQGTCPASGSPQLTAKIAVTGYINRSVNIISWSPGS